MNMPQSEIPFLKWDEADVASGFRQVSSAPLGQFVRVAPISDVPMRLRAHADSGLPPWISCWTLEVKQPTSCDWPQHLPWQPHSSLGRIPGLYEWSQPLGPRQRYWEEQSQGTQETGGPLKGLGAMNETESEKVIPQSLILCSGYCWNHLEWSCGILHSRSLCKLCPTVDLLVSLWIPY